jgi:hypothetical protein
MRRLPAESRLRRGQGVGKQTVQITMPRAAKKLANLASKPRISASRPLTSLPPRRATDPESVSGYYREVAGIRSAAISPAATSGQQATNGTIWA